MKLNIVILKSGKGRTYAYGPFHDRDEAIHFAEFLSKEVDPAEVVPLFSPVDELLGYWRNFPKEQS